jgi:hypothetical protein
LCIIDEKTITFIPNDLFSQVMMLPLFIVALWIVFAAASTPDNVSSRLMIHVSFQSRVT